MKRLLMLCILFLFITDSFARGGRSSGHSVSVRSYTRSDGTQVRAHTRGGGGYDSSSSYYDHSEKSNYTNPSLEGIVFRCGNVFQSMPCNDKKQ